MELGKFSSFFHCPSLSLMRVHVNVYAMRCDSNGFLNFKNDKGKWESPACKTNARKYNPYNRNEFYTNGWFWCDCKLLWVTRACVRSRDLCFLLHFTWFAFPCCTIYVVFFGMFSKCFVCASFFLFIYFFYGLMFFCLSYTEPQHN